MNILVRMIALGSVLATVACAPAKPIRNAIADARPAFVAGPTPDFVSAPVAGATPFPPVAGATPFPPVAGATPFLPWRVHAFPKWSECAVYWPQLLCPHQPEL